MKAIGNSESAVNQVRGVSCVSQRTISREVKHYRLILAVQSASLKVLQFVIAGGMADSSLAIVLFAFPIAANHGATSKPQRVTYGRVVQWCGDPSDVNVGSAAQSKGWLDVNGSFHEVEVSIRNNRFDRENPEDRLTFVIRFLSRSPVTTIQRCCNLLFYSSLSPGRLAMTKGNIHPLVGANLLAPAATSAAKLTAATVKTGQTDQIVIRISSVPVSGCYQRNAMLPAQNRGR